MDETSIDVVKSNPHSSGVSYFDFITNAGCKIITAKELIKRCSRDEEMESKLNLVHNKIKLFNRLKFYDREIEILPVSVEADFLKTVFLSGFVDQAEQSLNICMDLDLTQDRSKSKLPQSPADFMPSSDMIHGAMVPYREKDLNLLTREDKRLIKSDEKVAAAWPKYEERLNRGGTHICLAGDDVIESMRAEFHDRRVYMSGEFIASRGNANDLSQSIDQANDALNLVYEEIIKTSPDHIDEALQQWRVQFVNHVIANLYTNWQKILTQGENSVDYLAYPEKDFGIIGCYDIETWKTVGGNAESAFFYSPNCGFEDIDTPWSAVITGMKDGKTISAKIERPKFEDVQQFIDHYQPPRASISGQEVRSAEYLEDRIENKNIPQDSWVSSIDKNFSMIGEAIFLGAVGVLCAIKARNHAPKNSTTKTQAQSLKSVSKSGDRKSKGDQQKR